MGLEFERGATNAYALSAMARLSVPALRTALAIAIAGQTTGSIAETAVALEESGRSPADLTAPMVDELVASMRAILFETEAEGRIGCARALAERAVTQHWDQIAVVFNRSGLNASDPRCFIPGFLLAERGRGAEVA